MAGDRAARRLALCTGRELPPSVSSLPLCEASYSLCHRLKISNRVRPSPVTPFGVIDHVRHMVVNEKAVELHLVQCPEYVDHIHVAVADEALLEARHGPFHIAHVDICDLLARPKMPDNIRNRLAQFRPAAE